MTLNYEKEAKRALLHYFKVVKPDLDTDCYAEIQLIVHNIIRAAAQEAQTMLEHHLDQDHPQWTCPSCGSLNKMGFHFCQFCRKLDEKHEELVWAAEYDANIAQWEAEEREAQPEELETAGFEDTAANIISWLLNMYVAHDAWEGQNESHLLVETALKKLNDAHELYTPQPEEPEPTPPINPFRHLNNKQLIDIIRNIPEGGGLGAEAKAIIQQEWEMTRDLIADHLARCQFSHLVEFIGLAARHMEFDIYNFRSRLAEILDLVEELKGLQPDGTCWGDIVTAEKKQEAERKKQNRMMHY